MAKILLIMFAAVITENFIFSRFYGICPFLGVSDKPSTALGMGMSVTFVMTLSSAATYLVYNYALVPLGLEYLKTVAFILVIAALVQFIDIACPYVSTHFICSHQSPLRCNLLHGHGLLRVDHGNDRSAKLFSLHACSHP